MTSLHRNIYVKGYVSRLEITGQNCFLDLHLQQTSEAVIRGWQLWWKNSYSSNALFWYLSMPTAVAGVGFSEAFTCLSVFVYTISKKRCSGGSPNLAQKCPTMSSGNPFIFESKGPKVKVTRHTNKLVPVFRWKAILPFAAYAIYAGVLPADMPRSTSHASDTAFPRVTSPRPMLQPTAGFSMRGVFRSQPAAKTLPAWVMALLWVLAFFSCLLNLVVVSDKIRINYRFWPRRTSYATVIIR